MSVLRVEMARRYEPGSGLATAAEMTAFLFHAREDDIEQIDAEIIQLRARLAVAEGNEELLRLREEAHARREELGHLRGLMAYVLFLAEPMNSPVIHTWRTRQQQQQQAAPQ